MPQRIGDLTGEAEERLRVRPLETIYGGVSFRSRLEARWAVFFDSLKITWHYEEEGFRLSPSLCYLPDFWFPRLAFFIEIKPAYPSYQEQQKCSLLAMSTHRMVYLFHQGFVPEAQDELPTALAFFPNGDEDASYRWCECLQCGQIGIQFEGRSDRLPCKSARWVPREQNERADALSQRAYVEATGRPYPERRRK